MRKTELTTLDDTLTIKQGKKTSAFKTFGTFELRFKDIHLGNDPQNIVYVSQSLYNTIIAHSTIAAVGEERAAELDYGKFDISKKFILLNEANSLFLDCYIEVNKKLQSNEILCNKYTLKALGINLVDSQASSNSDPIILKLTQMQQCRIEKFSLQNVENIKHKNIYVSEVVYDTIINKNFKLYSFNNNLTGATLIVPIDKIKKDSTLSANEIRLARFQREFLDLEMSSCYSDKVFALLQSIASDKNNEQFKKALEQNYETEKRSGIIKTDSDYNDRKKFFELLKGFNLISITIKPELSSYRKKPKRDLVESATRLIVGKSIATLKCVRPYNEDESAEIVRISKGSMTILGIEEMDKVKITHGMTSICCKAVAFDDNQSRIEKTNKFVNPHTSIGISSDLRKRLNIHDIYSTVKIERSTKFLFMKNIRRSLISTFLTIYSIVKVFPLEWKYAIPVCLVFIPTAIYAMFTDIRLKV